MSTSNKEDKKKEAKKKHEQKRIRPWRPDLTPQERDQIKAKAEAFGLSAPEYLKICALKKAMPKPLRNGQEILKMKGEIRKIGNNVNQIAKVLNSQKEVRNPDNLEKQLKLLSHDLHQILKKVDE